MKGGSQDAAGWAQLRKAVVPPLANTRSDLAVIFDLACRLGLGQHFFGGDLEQAWRYQLEPSGITLEQLRTHPIGVKSNIATQYRKSPRFAMVGYDPLPSHTEPIESPIATSELAREYPLILTSFRHLQFVDQQHRNIPRLRRTVREPVIEIHPGTAAEIGVVDGEWVNLETVSGKIRLKAKYNDALYPRVSRPGESHPQALAEPYMNVAAHTAPITQPSA
jgi:anaerobic selenocysteine-containing dehydrogenase